MENQKSSIVKKGVKRATRNIPLGVKIKIGVIAGIVALVGLIVIGGISSMQMSTTRRPTQEIVGGNKPLSAEVLEWQRVVERYAEQFGISQLVPYAMAIMQVESGGNLPDLMQSSESAGLPVNTLKYEESIEQGMRHLSNVYNIAKSYGMENNLDGICQSYNYGVAYMHYLGGRSKEHNLETAEEYSRDVVAPSLGNTTGATYSYVNEVSVKYGKTYLYWNGGNFFYSELVKQYIGTGTGTGEETSGGAPTLGAPAEYKDKLTLPPYNGMNYNSSGSYPFGQCTWYAYNRMAQLGKRVDGNMGNGGFWGQSGRAKGYKVYNRPKVGTAVSFSPGVAGSSSLYGHVAVVEYVNSDGSILVSECNVVNPGSGTVSWRVISARDANVSLYVEP